MKYDVIIVGAGAAGLLAMRDLTDNGYKVCLLEAAKVAGGRIATFYNDEWEQTAEGGAEFIHGNLPLTLQLLDEAGITYIQATGEMLHIKNGVWQADDEQEDHWEQFARQLDNTKEDMSICAFLKKYFSAPEYATLRKSVQGFAEGFDLADITKASVLAVKNEWQHQDEKQYRVNGGYGKLVDHLEKGCKKGNGMFYFNTCVEMIEHRYGHVIVYTQNGDRYEASKVIITVSAGVLQSGAIRFEPALPAYEHAIRQLGFGSVIKFLLYFKNNFWQDRGDSIGFLLSDEDIPTWWTQRPHKSNLLTGWLGGPRADARTNEDDASLLSSALTSLSNIFHLPLNELRSNLVFHNIFCWRNNPYSKGGYSYGTVESPAAKQILSQPVADSIYFAGEAVYTGDVQGTVEAALQTGRAAARSIMDL